MRKGIVYTEIHNWELGTVERWFYGIYNYDRANDVAYDLGHDREAGIFHCVCGLDEAEQFGIMNMPTA